MGKFKRKHYKRICKNVKSPIEGLSCTITHYEEEDIFDSVPKTKKLLREFYTTLKKRNKFGTLINNYEPVTDYLRDTDEDVNREAYLYNRQRYGFTIPIVLGDKVAFRIPRYTNNFANYWGKAIILKSLFHQKDNVWQEKPMYQLKDGLELYIKDELAREGYSKATYPNEVAFIVRFGLIFGIIAYLILMFFAFRAVSPVFALKASCIILIWAVIFKLNTI